MASRSTASSRTDPGDQEPTDAAATPPRVQGGSNPTAHDADRRAFFFQFGRQAVTAVGQVAGMADIVGRTSSALAGELFGLDETEARPPLAFARSGLSTDPVVTSAAPAAEDTYRSAFRMADEGLVILDQRRVPEALEEVVAKRGSDVAYYLRLGVARGGPLMAQLAAYGLALTAAERSDLAPEQRRLELRRTARAMVEARPSSRLLAWAVERMESAATSVPEPADGDRVAIVLRAEADAIAWETAAAEAAMAAALVEALPSPEGRALSLLLHGAHGALVGGQLGAGIAALTRMRDAGRTVRVFVTEGRPFMDGARLAAWELRQAGIDHRIVPDAAAAWLFDREPVDVVLMRAEYIAANGDTSALVGARSLAQVAAAAGGDRPRLAMIGPSAAVDPSTPDGASLPSELRPARELATYLAGVPVRASDALVPAADVVPAALVDLRVNETAVEPAMDPS